MRQAVNRDLRRISLHEALNPAFRVVRLTEGQSLDAMLDAAYRAGWVLLEVDEQQEPLRAYRIDVKGRER